MFYIQKIRLINFVLSIANKIFKVGVPPFPSTAAIIEKDKKILLVDLNYKDGYALPGGILKGKENFETAIRREVKEETGLDVTSCKYFGSFSGDDNYQTTCVVFKIKTKGELTNSNEGTPVWRDPRKVIDQLVYQDNRKAIKRHIK